LNKEKAVRNLLKLNDIVTIMLVVNSATCLQYCWCS